MLLLVLLLLVSSVQAQTECLHDGFYNNGNESCTCTPDFAASDSYCKYGFCENEGLLLNYNKQTSTRNYYGCTCPPGYLGTNCQPVKCIKGGDESTFYDQNSTKSLTLFFTANANFQSWVISTNSSDAIDGNRVENIAQTVCTMFNKSGYGKLTVLFGFGQTPLNIQNTSIDACINTFNSLYTRCYEDVEDGYCFAKNTLSAADIAYAVAQSNPNSPVYIISTVNYSLNDAVAFENIQRMAIANRITVTFFALPTTLSQNEDSTFNQDVGYQNARALAESTMGYFITPYHMNAYVPFNHTLCFTLSTLFGLRTSGYDHVQVGYINDLATNFPLNAGNITVAVRYANDPRPMNSITEAFGAYGLKAQVDTGYWKLFQGPYTMPLQIRDRGTTGLVAYFVQAKTHLKAQTATTTSKLVDAVSPYIYPNSFSNLLVARAVTTGSLSKYLVLPGDPPSSQIVRISSSISTRDCQFNYVIGSIKCFSNVTKYLMLSSDDNIASAVPLICASSAPVKRSLSNSPQEDPQGVELAELDEGNISERAAEELDAEACAPSSDANTLASAKPLREFVIISRNAMNRNNSTDPTTALPSSTIDNLYIGPNNILQYVAPLDNVFYFQYTYNLIDTASATKTIVPSLTNFGTFVSKLMNDTSQAINNTADMAVEYGKALLDTLTQTSSSVFFSDIMLVMDSGNTTFPSDSDLYTIYNMMYTKRSRLYILLVEATAPFPDDMTRWANLAARSGGVLLRVNNYDRLNSDFFNTLYYSSSQPILQSEVVYQVVQNTTYTTTISSDTFYAASTPDSANNTMMFRLFVTGNSGTPITFNGNQVAATTVFGETSVYNLTAVNGACTVNATVNSTESSLLVFSSGADRMSTIAFTKDPSIDESSTVLHYASSDSEIPVASLSNPAYHVKSFSVVKPSGEKLIDNSPAAKRSCSAFTYSSNYNFNNCEEQNGIYYVSTVLSNGNGNDLSRMQVYTCLSSDKHPECPNGGTVIQTGLCSCAPGWSGAMCNTRVCQNGGTLLTSGQCNCTIAYNGNFCEISQDICVNSPPIPDTRSEVTSFIFIVDKAVPLTTLPGLTTMQGPQTVLYSYSCNDAGSLLLSSSDSSLLQSALKGAANTTTPTCGSTDNTAQAIVNALKAQVGPRSVAILVTATPFQPSSDDWQSLVNQLSKTRTDLRIYSTVVNANNQNLTLLATLGNGLPFISNDGNDFATYFNKYIFQLLDQTPLGIPGAGPGRLSVVQSGTANNVTNISVTCEPNYAENKTIFIHLKGGNTAHTGCSTNIGSATGSIIISCSCDTKTAYTISLDGPSSYSYSVEYMTPYKLAYGFQRAGSQEMLNMGPEVGVSNYVSLYSSSSQSGATVETMPYIVLSAIYPNGTVGFPTTTLGSAFKNSSTCTYPYYSSALTCEPGVYGYKASIRTKVQKTGLLRQEQRVFSCFSALQCQNGGTLVEGTCYCLDKWTGVDCSQPFCSNGATVANGICICPDGTQGDTCSPNMSNASRAMAFIIDVNGGDPYLFNKTIASIQSFLALYPATTYVFLTDTQAKIKTSGFTNTQSDIKNTLLSYRSSSDNAVVDLQLAFDAISSAVDSAPSGVQAIILSSTSGVKSAEISVIYYMTQVNATLSNRTSLNTLKKQDNFAVATIAFKASSRMRFTPNSDINVISDKVYEVINESEAENAMYDFAQNGPSPPPTVPADSAPCTKALQSNVMFIVDVIGGYNTTSVDITTKQKQLMQTLNAAFETNQFGVIMPPNQTCFSGEIKQMDRQTLMNGMFVSQPGNRDYSVFQPPKSAITFCPAYNGFNRTLVGIIPTGNANSTAYTQTVLNTIAGQINNECLCTRNSDLSTYKLTVWLSRDEVTIDTSLNYTDITSSNNIHFIVAFNFDVETSTFHKYLVDQSIQKANALYGITLQNSDLSVNNAQAMDVATLSNTLTTKFCKLNQKIPQGSEASRAFFSSVLGELPPMVFDAQEISNDVYIHDLDN